MNISEQLGLDIVKPKLTIAHYTFKKAFKYLANQYAWSFDATLAV
jgi:hypothetical protein